MRVAIPVLIFAACTAALIRPAHSFALARPLGMQGLLHPPTPGGIPGRLPHPPSSSLRPGRGRGSARGSLVVIGQFVKGMVDEEDGRLNQEDIPGFKDLISHEALEAVDLRVGVVAFAETIPDPEHDNKPSRKYLKLKVNLGSEVRTIVAGCRGIVDVEEAVGKKVLVAANTPPETVLGVESRGRILTASNPTKEPIPRTLRTILVKGGGLPSGSPVSFT